MPALYYKTPSVTHIENCNTGRVPVIEPSAFVQALLVAIPITLLLRAGLVAVGLWLCHVGAAVLE